MRTFFELLPYRIASMLGWRTARQINTRIGRYLSANRLNRPANRGPRLYIDLAVISNHDAGTGIQRVVRALALAVLDEQTQLDICFVSATRKRRYHHISWPDRSRPVTADEMRAEPGDIFIGLDYSLDAIRRHRRQLTQFRRDGGTLWFLVHDLLPLTHPQWFSRNTIIRYKAWLGIISRISDGFFCNSEHTESELKKALNIYFGLINGYRTKILPMGFYISDTPHDVMNHSDIVENERLNTSKSFALMVGTLEPRKGHYEVISSFSKLWDEGSNIILVIVGRLGWQVDSLHDLIVSHPQNGEKLFWFDDVDDAELISIYNACTGVIIASHGEGFGLPVIEALGRGKPVLARDLPVFRVHEGSGICFFPTYADTTDLSARLVEWFDAAQAGSIVVTPPTGSWNEAAALMLASVKSTPK